MLFFFMKLGLLLSGGKDSVFAGFLAKKSGHDLVACISIVSKNKDSYMFHTPSIKNTEKQAESMGIPLIVRQTRGEKEIELKDLEVAIKNAKEKYGIEGVVTGAVKSVYQASRIQKICNKLKLEVFNPLWQINEEEYLKNLLKEKFDVIVVGVFAYPLGKDFLGRKIDKNFEEEFKKLRDKYGISLIGEGGEFESFVLDCPLFSKKLEVKGFKDEKEGGNSFRRELIIY